MITLSEKLQKTTFCLSMNWIRTISECLSMCLQTIKNKHTRMFTQRLVKSQMKTLLCNLVETFVQIPVTEMLKGIFMTMYSNLFWNLLSLNFPSVLIHIFRKWLKCLISFLWVSWTAILLVHVTQRVTSKISLTYKASICHIQQILCHKRFMWAIKWKDTNFLDLPASIDEALPHAKQESYPNEKKFKNFSHHTLHHCYGGEKFFRFKKTEDIFEIVVVLRGCLNLQWWLCTERWQWITSKWLRDFLQMLHVNKHKCNSLHFKYTIFVCMCVKTWLLVNTWCNIFCRITWKTLSLKRLRASFTSTHINPCSHSTPRASGVVVVTFTTYLCAMFSRLSFATTHYFAKWIQITPANCISIKCIKCVLSSNSTIARAALCNL